jgi:hypothetical protein
MNFIPFEVFSMGVVVNAIVSPRQLNNGLTNSVKADTMPND